MLILFFNKVYAHVQSLILQFALGTVHLAPQILRGAPNVEYFSSILSHVW